MHALLVVALLFVVLLLAHAVWTLAYAHSPRRKVDARLRSFVTRK